MNNFITGFFIDDLHGHKNVKIDFDSRFKILLSENGQGKTTILKCIDAIFQANTQRLNNINFRAIGVNFSNGESAILRKEELGNLTEWKSRAYKYLEEKLPDPIFKDIINIAIINERKLSAREAIVNYINNQGYKVSTMAVREFLEERDSISQENRKNTFFQKIKESVEFESLYLPTYRRIEDDLSSLDIKISENKSSLIQFSLKDVEEKLVLIKSEMLKISNESMTRINGEILTKLVNGLTIDQDDMNIIHENSEKIDLVLKRVGHALSEHDKTKIINLVNSGAFLTDNQNLPLVYFLSKMCKAFWDQKHSDKALTDFSTICSNYFVNKKMIYDERELTVKIWCGDSGNEISFGHLSSGEKQIVSIFYKLILDPKNGYFLLFDEPELSLSVEWQKKILNDIIEINSCKMMLAMTHSPFIFKNLSHITSDLSMYISKTTDVIR